MQGGVQIRLRRPRRIPHAMATPRRIIILLDRLPSPLNLPHFIIRIYKHLVLLTQNLTLLPHELRQQLLIRRIPLLPIQPRQELEPLHEPKHPAIEESGIIVPVIALAVRFERYVGVAISALDVNVEGLVLVARADVLEDLLDATIAVVAAVVVFEPLRVVGESFCVIGLRAVAVLPVNGDLGVVEVGGSGFVRIAVGWVARFVEFFCEWVETVFDRSKLRLIHEKRVSIEQFN